MMAPREVRVNRIIDLWPNWNHDCVLLIEYVAVFTISAKLAVAFTFTSCLPMNCYISVSFTQRQVANFGLQIC